MPVGRALLALAAAAAAQKVAIVGSGVGGSAAAYFLARASGGAADVRVFERDARVGGRARTVDVFGRRLDAGATAISSLNRYLVGFVAQFGLDVAPDAARPGALGIWNGSALVLEARGARTFRENVPSPPLGAPSPPAL